MGKVDKIVVRDKKGFISLAVISMSLLLIMCLIAMKELLSDGKTQEIILCALGIVVFIVPLIQLLKRFLYPKPTAILTREGIITRFTTIKADIVFWDDIKDIDLNEDYNGVFIEIRVRNRKDYFNKISEAERKKVKLISQQNLPIISIPVQRINMDIEEFVDMLLKGSEIFSKVTLEENKEKKKDCIISLESVAIYVGMFYIIFFIIILMHDYLPLRIGAIVIILFIICFNIMNVLFTILSIRFAINSYKKSEDDVLKFLLFSFSMFTYTCICLIAQVYMSF